MNLAIVGLQWGDEGKGKIVDILSGEFDCVARYQGGHNAGHTVTFGKNRHVLHLVPSGIFHDGVLCVVGGGVVLDPVAFFEETDAIAAAGIEVAGRLFVSPLRGSPDYCGSKEAHRYPLAGTALVLIW